MSFGLLNLVMLLGLAGLVIPPVIHLLNRRRHDVVDWGAMRFLQTSDVTRRRLMIEEWLLMALRMALIALLVLGLASPYVESPVLTSLGVRANRDVVLVFDGSASMGFAGSGLSTHEAAKEWALAFLRDSAPGDGVAVLRAGPQVLPVVGEPSSDLGRVAERIQSMPPPGGSCDWPAAVQAAHALLADSKRPERDIILLGDGQRFGWADDTSLLRWGLLAQPLGSNRPDSSGEPVRPRVWVVNLDPNRPADPPNWSLTPLRGNRPVVPVEREVVFRTDLVLHGQSAYAPPHRVRLEVDGKWVRDLEAPRSVRLQNGKVPLSFTHRFATPGPHLVTVLLEPDPPPEDRPAGYVIKDQLPGDNRQDFALEVLPALPVLIVDGDPSPNPSARGAFFLRDALSPARDRTPTVRARVVSVRDFEPALLTAPAEEGGAEEAGEKRPRVLILCDVAHLSPAQQDAVGQFLADGGGVLVTLGGRAEATAYNEQLFGGGQGWLPARLDGVQGDPADLGRAARPALESSSHPALELFRELPAGGLGEARFPRWWKLSTPGPSAAGVAVAQLRSASSEHPFLVERSFRAGRVLLCAVPLDNTWGTNLPDLPAFVPLSHELVYYLAGARVSEFNLEPGQPLRYRLESPGRLDGFTLQPPGGEPKPLVVGPPTPGAFMAQVLRQARGSLLVHERMKETGVYRLKTPDGHLVYYVVQPDARESDLAACTEEDRARVAKLLPLTYENDRSHMMTVLTSTSERQEIWWWFLLGLVGLLCAEVWMTRRLVKNRSE